MSVRSNLVSEPEYDDSDPRPLDWEKLFRWLFVIGVSLWVIAGAVYIVLLAYFAGPFGGTFYTDSESAGRIVTAITRIAFTVESIAFKAWIASGVLLAFVWLRTRLGTQGGT
jgi:hypothetical protein